MSRSNPNRIGRRRFITRGTTTTLTAASADAESLAAAGPRRQSLIQNENAREGSHDWQLTRVRVVPGKGNLSNEAYRSPAIGGYCSRQSVAVGETIEFMISASPPSR